MITNEKFPNKLLVEGNDDQHVIWALCEKYSITKNFDVIDCNGFNSLLNQIPVRLKQSDIRVLGIIVDADLDFQSRWTFLRNQILKLNFEIPESIPKNGLIVENTSNLRLGLWIMPDNNLNGMLEDFLNFLIPKEDKLQKIAVNTLKKIEESQNNLYPIQHRTKALIHTWLSWQESPGTPFGLSITKKYLSVDEPSCRIFTNWIRQLFE